MMDGNLTPRQAEFVPLHEIREDELNRGGGG